jgi:SAM-dependent methyltransferase
MKLYTIETCKYNSVLQCPVCGYEDVFEKLVTYSSTNLHRDYIKCSCCGLVFCHPLTVPDYADSHSGEIAGHYSYECYVDIGASIESMIRPLIPLLTNSITDLDSFLDVGCGFGYCVKFANTIMGLKSVGYEPGEYGKIGSKVLNINVVNQYFRVNSSTEKYSVIFSSEVIEHIDDPTNYIRTLCNTLKPKGIAVLTTPNTNYLYHCLETQNDSDIKALSLLGPGQHLCLFNKQAMVSLLEKCGISKFKIFEEDASLIVYFSHDLDMASLIRYNHIEARRHYLDFLKLLGVSEINKRQGIWNIVERFFNKFIRRHDRENQDLLTARFEVGIAYRLMRELTNDGDFIKAREIEEKYEILYINSFNQTIYEALESIVVADIEQCDSPLSLLKLFSERKVSFNLYGFLFYKTNLALNDGRDIKTNLSELISTAKKATDILDSLFMNLNNSPLALTWFGEYFRLHPRFCFGLAMLYLHADNCQEALYLLDKLLVIVDENIFETDSLLQPDCLIQKAVIFFRNNDLPNFLICTKELSQNYPEYCRSSKLFSQIVITNLIV